MHPGRRFRRSIIRTMFLLLPALAVAIPPPANAAGTESAKWFDGRAQWIWSAEGTWSRQAGDSAYPTRFFRKSFESLPGDTLTVAVSADTRYRLWCNGEQVSAGPAKGDINHHFFAEIDLAPFLRSGINTLAAQVEFHGAVWPNYRYGGGNVSMMTACPGFILDGEVRDSDGMVRCSVRTDRSWKVLVDRSIDRQIIPGCSPCVGLYEDLDCANYPWGFQETGFNDSDWGQPVEIAAGVPVWADRDSPMPHRLTPRIIAPLERLEDRRFESAFRSDGVESNASWTRFLAGEREIMIPANTTAEVFIDAGALQTGYPILEFSGGRDSIARLSYAEALKAPDGSKGNRNDHDFGDLSGCEDIVRPDGAEHTYSPFFWRTFRFVKLRVETAEEPLQLRQLTYHFTAYPFQDVAHVETSDPVFNQIWDVCWRTARLCAHETYEDCPYYEQLQYAGDTQIQALISYLVAGDATLARQYLMQFDWSRQSNGLTRSRYPSQIPQTIPYWSLHWILSVHDYWWYTGDLETVKALYPGVRTTMDYFIRKIGPSGTLGRLDGWLVADWCPEWSPGGMPPGAGEGVAAYDSLMVATAMKATADLARACGQPDASLEETLQALKTRVHQLYFVEKSGFYADRPGTFRGSAFTNVWAILADMPCDQAALAERIFSDPDLCPLTMFSQSFAWDALARANRFDLFPQTLDFWKQTLEWGLSTCPEIPDLARTRSDCHAWSAGPLIAWTREILGVRPLAPGWEVIGIEPKPSGLTSAKGTVPITRTNANQTLETVDVEWRIDEGKFILKGKVPEGHKCKVRLPGEDWQEVNEPEFKRSRPWPI